MDIKDLKVFHTIAKEESIAKASRILYMTPQGISKIVKNLEAEMGCRLFTRNKSGMQLTESGRRFLVSGRNLKQNRMEITHKKKVDIK